MFRRALTRSAALLAVPLLVPILGATAAHASAAPSITIYRFPQLTYVVDSSNHAAAIAIVGDTVSTATPITLGAGSACTAPTFDGTNYHTTCAGTPMWDAVLGDGNDTLLADTNGSLTASGDDGNDTMLGGSIHGSTYLTGANGDDTVALIPSASPSEAHGGAGHDTLYGSSRADSLFGGGGADTFNAKDGVVDHIDCGQNDGAKDTVNMDFAPRDVLANCSSDIKQ
jgi:Ca2+-binding RTX toxin-like protein